ncbi:MAG: Hsp20 family protein [Lachnospiraceae bacterium]|jgi:HSP20 family protein|nr:Hsp20 family protein [Lachnospiraceae bacterium]MEE3461205.1 Hsp20 family protein [Lachnospiraceae bacterium]
MLLPDFFRDNSTSSLFDDFFDDSFAAPMNKFYHSSDIMKTDIYDNGDSYEIGIELPGIKKEDIKVQLKEGYLTVSAETKKKNDEKDEKGKYIRKERYYGSSSRSYYVGDEIKDDDIKAKFEDGILKITIPKKEEEKKVEEDKFISIDG